MIFLGTYNNNETIDKGLGNDRTTRQQGQRYDGGGYPPRSTSHPSRPNKTCRLKSGWDEDAEIEDPFWIDYIVFMLRTAITVVSGLQK
jgi:hypothetical protein